MDQSVIAPVDPNDPAERADLETLLGEYHDWMARTAGAKHDAEAERAADLAAVSENAGCRAWIARVDGEPVGCVLLYEPSERLAEFKRLYVRPTHRGEGIGRRLVEAVVGAAADRGFSRVGLSTPPWSEAAHELYESMGFERTDPYPETKLPERHHDEAIFMQLDLDGR